MYQNPSAMYDNEENRYFITFKNIWQIHIQNKSLFTNSFFLFLQAF